MRFHKKLARICLARSHGPNQSSVQCKYPAKCNENEEDNCTRKSTSDDTNGEKVHRATGNIEDLVKRNKISDTSSTMALDRTKATIGNGNNEMGGGRMM